ncbi:MAG: hypothetical protein EOO60_04940, partial [Hymenobacter sp.]
ARTQYAGAGSDNERVTASNNLEGALGRLLVIQEQYPDLQSNQAVRDLITELEGTENRVAQERRTYNDIVTPPMVSDYDLNLSYLNLPVLLRMALGPVYLEAGPQASLLIGGRGQGTTKGTLLNKGMYTRPIDQAATDRYTRLDAGFCLGVGARLPAGLGVSLRAYQGLAQLNRGNESTPTSIPYSGNYEYRQVFSASLTYQVTTTHQ